MPAIVMDEVNHTNSTDEDRAVQIAATGVRYFGLTFASALEAGRPPSREKAKIMREQTVTVARPQRNCDDEDRDVEQLLDAVGSPGCPCAQKNTFQPCLAASSMFGIISTKAHSITQPNSADHKTDDDHAARHGVRRLHGLFRGMRRSVIAGDRVDRQQQAEQERHQP